jgi:arsenate reductase
MTAEVLRNSPRFRRPDQPPVQPGVRRLLAPWEFHPETVKWGMRLPEEPVSTAIYHNPRCSKSRRALQLLRDRGVEPEVIEYLKTPPDAAALRGLLDLLGLEPRDLMRKKEKEYREMGLDDPGLTREALIAAMVAHPRLIERPIVVKDGRAVLGRPPERVIDLL